MQTLKPASHLCHAERRRGSLQFLIRTHGGRSQPLPSQPGRVLPIPAISVGAYDRWCRKFQDSMLTWYPAFPQKAQDWTRVCWTLLAIMCPYYGALSNLLTKWAALQMPVYLWYRQKRGDEAFKVPALSILLVSTQKPNRLYSHLAFLCQGWLVSSLSLLIRCG